MSRFAAFVMVLLLSLTFAVAAPWLTEYNNKNQKKFFGVDATPQSTFRQTLFFRVVCGFIALVCIVQLVKMIM